MICICNEVDREGWFNDWHALSNDLFLTILMVGLIIFIPLTNRASPILRFQAGSAITMECICVHTYIYIYSIYIQ